MSERLNVSSNPHIRSKATTNGIMAAVVFALLPAAGFGIYNFGIKALVLILVTVASTVGTEFLYGLYRKKQTISDLSAVVTGLLLAMNLPVSVPWWVAVMGGVFAILVVKMLFGGLGQNFMNPALAARCFLLISFPALMTNFSYDTFTGATPLAALKAGESVNVTQMIIGTTAGTIGETSMLAIVIGACILIMLGIIDLRIPGSYIVSFSAFIILFGGRGLDFHFLSAHLAGGGLMLGAFFMATDMATSPMTMKGKIIFSIGVGALTIIIRLWGAYPEGMSFAILIMNAFVPLINKVCKPKRFGNNPVKQ